MRLIWIAHSARLLTSWSWNCCCRGCWVIIIIIVIIIVIVLVVVMIVIGWFLKQKIRKCLIVQLNTIGTISMSPSEMWRVTHVRLSLARSYAPFRLFHPDVMLFFSCRFLLYARCFFFSFCSVSTRHFTRSRIERCWLAQTDRIYFLIFDVFRVYQHDARTNNRSRFFFSLLSTMNKFDERTSIYMNAYVCTYIHGDGDVYRSIHTHRRPQKVYSSISFLRSLAGFFFFFLWHILSNM